MLLGSDASADQNITVHPPHRYAGRVAVQAIPAHLAHVYKEEQESTKARQWSHQGGRTPLPLVDPDSIVKVLRLPAW